MEGSSSTSKRGGDGLPPVARRSNRRRTDEENPNNNREEGIEIAAEEAEPNLQPQPQQVGGGEMEPAAIDNRSRLANRRYSEAYRSRRQNHLLLLQTQQDNLEAEIAQNAPLVDNYMIQKSFLQVQNASLKRQLDAAFADILSKEGETERLRAEIEEQKKRNEAEHQQIMNTMLNPSFFALQAAFMNSLSAALGPWFPSEGMNPPTDGSGEGGLGTWGQNQPSNPDQAGPSGDMDPHN